MRSVISVMRSVEHKSVQWIPCDQSSLGQSPKGYSHSGAAPVNSFLQRSRTLLSRFSSWICTFL